jgi:Flp pilus assembly protein TadD
VNGRARVLLLVLLLVALGGYYVYSQRLDSIVATWRGLTGRTTVASPVAAPADSSAALPFDEETKADIRHYFEGVVVGEQDNVGEAIRLDQAVGRPQLANGQYREAYATYKKVLAISYKHANPMGIGIALNVLGSVAGRAGRT